MKHIRRRKKKKLWGKLYVNEKERQKCNFGIGVWKSLFRISSFRPGSKVNFREREKNR